MKRLILIILVFFCSLGHAFTQIITPQLKANFGVEADLRANFYNSFAVNGNDDWFSNLAGTGRGVIDTTGAAFLLRQYMTKPGTRSQPFFRGMAFPQYTVVNNRILIDGIFIRDHHGDDSTVFASGSNKNGMSPAMWSCPVSQGIPDKNDILDIMMHVRRDGPNLTDSLWMFGGVSIDNTTGNRYFDFEMYQTDITYDRATRTFQGFGPDAGHTSWQFDASGNITRAGDIIFTAEYSSSQLSSLEARIWVHSSALSSTPADFNWGGSFDGDGASATFGYASIVPKSAGAFYTGLQCGNNTWAGPFGVVLQDNSLQTNYTARQFMEFSVNLSKLGLDPLATQNNACGLPFRRILVKSRASTSFTAELKDFVGPFSFFRAPAANASADLPTFCGSTGIANICLDSALATSLYTWTTPNGNIVGDTVGSCITVDQPGLYIVRQQLMDSCGISYATDTVEIRIDPTCVLLNQSLTKWNAVINQSQASLSWSINNNAVYDRFIVEKSIDKENFMFVGELDANTLINHYQMSDNLSGVSEKYVYYRLKAVTNNGIIQYSKIISLPLTQKMEDKIIVGPNPMSNSLQLTIPSPADQNIKIEFIDQSGRVSVVRNMAVKKGINSLTIDNLDQLRNGIYFVRIQAGNTNSITKLIVTK